MGGGRAPGRPELSEETHLAEACSQMQQGLELLRKASDAAQVLAETFHCDIATEQDYIEASSRKMSCGSDASSDANSELGNLVDVNWECPFLFLLDSVDAAEVKVTVRRPTQGRERYPRISGCVDRVANLFKSDDPNGQELGTINYPVINLLGCPHFTEVATLRLYGSSNKMQPWSSVRLRLQLRPLQPPAFKGMRSSEYGQKSTKSMKSMKMSPTVASMKSNGTSSSSWTSRVFRLLGSSSPADTSFRRFGDRLGVDNWRIRDRFASMQIDDWCSASSGDGSDGEDSDFDESQGPIRYATAWTNS